MGRLERPPKDDDNVGLKLAACAAITAIGVIQVGVFSSSVLPLFGRFAGAPFVRTKRKALTHLFETILSPGRLGGRSLAGLRLVDMGSGDGRIVVEAAKRGMAAEGWELNPVLVAASRASAVAEGVSASLGRRSDYSSASAGAGAAVDRSTAGARASAPSTAGTAAGDGAPVLGSASFRTVNFWDESASLRSTDVVIFYALPELVERLRSKLVAELPVGAIAVSHRFPVTAWDPLHVSGAQGEWKMFVYDVHAAEAATATRRKARRQ